MNSLVLDLKIKIPKLMQQYKFLVTIRSDSLAYTSQNFKGFLFQTLGQLCRNFLLLIQLWQSKLIQYTLFLYKW